MTNWEEHTESTNGKMPWEETVLTPKQLEKVIMLDYELALKAQAKITGDIAFKAGWRKASIEVGAIAFQKGIKAGRREVVEWAVNNSDIICNPQWQAQLKIWFNNNPALLKGLELI